jgi:hypothetical protein
MFKLQMLKEDDANNFRLYLKPIARFHYSEIAQIYVVDKQFKKDVKKRFEEAKEKPDVIKF